MEEAFPDRETAFKTALLHSAEVFAAFKVHTAGRSMLSLLLDSNGALKPFEQWSRDVLPIASHQFGNWLRTEYNTAILRAHQAADWQRYESEKDVLPNLRWVPSTSVKPGQDHMLFWGTVLPVDHTFWSKHRPGDRWNCKCSLEATDDDVTPVPDDESLSSFPPQEGLESNPGKTAQLFGLLHPYFPDSCASCPFNSGLKNTLTTFFGKNKRDCYNCAKVNKAIPQTAPQSAYTLIPTNRGQVRIHTKHGVDEADENISIAKYLAEKYGYEIDLLPNPNNQKSADTFNRTLGYEQEYKTNATPTKGAIDGLLRKAARQASHIVMEVKSEIPLGVLRDGIKGRVAHGKIDEVIVIWNGKDLTLTKDIILSKDFKIQPEDFK